MKKIIKSIFLFLSVVIFGAGGFYFGSREKNIEIPASAQNLKNLPTSDGTIGLPRAEAVAASSEAATFSATATPAPSLLVIKPKSIATQNKPSPAAMNASGEKSSAAAPPKPETKVS